MEEQTAPAKKSIRWLPIYSLFTVAVLVLVSGLILSNYFGKEKITGADYVENLAKDQVTIGVIDQISGVYPNILYNVDELAIYNSVFEGLSILRDGRIQAGLAESWTNPDDLTWRVKIRDANFSNGTALKASDVKYSIEETKKNEDWVSSFIAARVDSVTVIDEKTVELKTLSPDPTLMQWLVFLFILSEDQVKAEGLEKAVGTGPYKLVSFDPSKVVLEANQDYWGGAPKVNKVVYQSVESREKQIEAMKKGELDIAYTASKEFEKSDLTANGFRILQGRASDLTFIGVDANVKEGNPLSSEKVRQALLLGLDVDKVIVTADRKAVVLSQFSSPDLVGYNQDLKRPAVDKVKAKALLTEAGYPNGFTLVLDVDEENVDVANALKDEAALIGVTLTVNSMPYNDFIDKAASGQSQMFILSYIPDTIDATDLLTAFVHSPNDAGMGAANFTAYTNTEIDSDLEKAAAVFDAKKRAEAVSKIQSKVMTQLPYIPLFSKIYSFVVRDTVAFKPAPFGYIFPYELSGREKATDSN